MINKNNDLVGTLIHDVAHLLRLEIDKRLAAHNLTRVKWLAMGIIHAQPRISQATLAAELELGHASVGRLVDRLVERGFILRDDDPNDRRSNLLSLTDHADRLIDDLDGMADTLRADTLKDFTDTEVTALSSALIKLKNTLKDHASAAVAPLIILSENAAISLEYLTPFTVAL